MRQVDIQSAKTLRDILETLIQAGWETEEIVGWCLAHREDVLILKKLGSDLELRIRRALDVLLGLFDDDDLGLFDDDDFPGRPGDLLNYAHPLRVQYASLPRKNHYDRFYILCPHGDCSHLCHDGLIVVFHKGAWEVTHVTDGMEECVQLGLDVSNLQTLEVAKAVLPGYKSGK